MRLQQITQDMEYLDFTYGIFWFVYNDININYLIYLFTIRLFRTDEGQKIISRKEKFIEQSKRIEADIFNEWSNNVPNDIHLNLVNHLLIRLVTNELSMNFDNKVSNAIQ